MEKRHWERQSSGFAAPFVVFEIYRLVNGMTCFFLPPTSPCFLREIPALLSTVFPAVHLRRVFSDKQKGQFRIFRETYERIVIRPKNRRQPQRRLRSFPAFPAFFERVQIAVESVIFAGIFRSCSEKHDENNRSCSRNPVREP